MGTDQCPFTSYGRSMTRHSLAVRTAAALIGAMLVAAAPAGAAVIDMEGIAPAGSNSTENNSTQTFDGFNVFINHGHYWDSAQSGVGTFRPDNGTDFLLHDHNTAVVVTKVGGGGFSIQSFDATFWDSSHNASGTSPIISVIGLLNGGGSIGTSFAIDNVHAFETLMFGAGWDDVTQVSFVNVSGAMAYDNIVVDAPAAAVPAPAALAAFGFGLAGMAALRRRRRA
ncbi:MAG: PEP-CTERM sorting domain-containing protein [Alphaproteobacteria bacterium]|nr:PEP-CTERM sorting domain-containing protein [Alphaproteobacteria bacterium]